MSFVKKFIEKQGQGDAKDMLMDLRDAVYKLNREAKKTEQALRIGANPLEEKIVDICKETTMFLDKIDERIVRIGRQLR